MTFEKVNTREEIIKLLKEGIIINRQAFMRIYEITEEDLK